MTLYNDGASERTPVPGDRAQTDLHVPIDQVLSAARRRGILSIMQLNALSRTASGSDAPLSWRQFALAFPGESDPLCRLAAEIYGFRSVTVCQIGTLIYNLKLTEFFSVQDWNRLFERGMVPVIEVGVYPDVVRHHLLAASDPGSGHVRSLVSLLPLSRIELVFVPKPGIQKLQAMLASTVPGLRANSFIVNRLASLTRVDQRAEYTGSKAA